MDARKLIQDRVRKLGVRRRSNTENRRISWMLIEFILFT